MGPRTVSVRRQHTSGPMATSDDWNGPSGLRCGRGRRHQRAIAMECRTAYSISMRVAKREEAVALAHGLGVGIHDLVARGEGGDEHHERGARHMEVGDERVDHVIRRPGHEIEVRRGIGARHHIAAPRRVSAPSARPSKRRATRAGSAAGASGSKALSSERTAVVPTAMTRLPARFVSMHGVGSPRPARG